MSSKLLATEEQIHYCLCFRKYSKNLFLNTFLSILAKKLLSKHQSGFRPNYSTTNQLLRIVHDLYTVFDANSVLELWRVFLDMSKTFDRVWHERLIYKLKEVNISCTTLAHISSFLNNNFQCVVLNEQSSNWLPLKFGVPHGSSLGLLLLNIYYDLLEKVTSTVKLFADDTFICSVVNGNNVSTNGINKTVFNKKTINFLMDMQIENLF